MLRRSIFAAFLVGLVSCSSAVGWAADASSQGYDWTGFYVGINEGWVGGTSAAMTETNFSPTGYFAASSVPAIKQAGDQQFNSRTFISGGQAGYNWQSGSLVLGGEMDLNYMHVTGGDSSTAVYPCCAPTNFTIQSSMHTDWLFTLRPRIGYASNNWLLYATGGLAVTKLNADFLFTDTFATAHEEQGFSETVYGWTAGCGVEMGLARNWSLKAEYLYADFGNISSQAGTFTAFTPPIAFPTNVFRYSMDLQTNTERIGLNYRF